MTQTEAPTQALVPANGAAAAALIHELGVTLDSDGLTLRKDAVVPDWPTWESILRSVTFLGEAWEWWLADALVLGESLFGEESAQAVDTEESRYDMAARVIGLGPGTCQNIASVGRRILKENRRTPPLKFWTHEPVAALPAEEQVYWLDQTIENGWSRGDLRDAIRAAKNPQDDTDDDTDDTGSGGGGVSTAERIEQAATVVWNTGQQTGNGDALVPRESWAQLGAALGFSE